MADFIDDIPEAQRDTLIPHAEPAASAPFHWSLWLLLMAIVGLGGGLGVWFLQSGDPIATGAAPAEPAPVPDSPAEPSAAPAATLTAETPAASPAANAALLGHRPYDIVDEANLVTLSTNALVRLQPEVAQKVETMMAEARTAGVSLDVISGFRSLEDQQYLFFDLSK